MGRERALKAWRILFRSSSFFHAAIESEDATGARRIVSFGSAVFVTDAFANQEVAQPRPGLNDRIIASISSLRPAVLDDAGLRRANSCGGLQVVILSPSSKRSLLAREADADINASLAKAFLHFLQGYRLRRIMREATSQSEVAHMRAQRVFGRIVTFHAGRVFGVTERDDGFSVPGSVGAMLFSYREPILRFRAVEQCLLIAALRGLTDEDLARTLGLSVPAVKKRWVSVFSRIASAKPDLLPVSDGVDRRIRGPQKRYHLLAYLREHPEELRPVL